MKTPKIVAQDVVIAAGVVAVAYAIYSLTKKSDLKKNDPKPPVPPTPAPPAPAPPTPALPEKRLPPSPREGGHVYYDVTADTPLLSGPGTKYSPIAEPNLMHRGYIASSTGFICDDPDWGNLSSESRQTYAEIITIGGGTAWANLAQLAPHNK